MDELTKAFPNVWCPNCNKVQPMEFATMKANDRNDHDAADILCGECKFVVATLHAEPRAARRVHATARQASAWTVRGTSAFLL